MCFRCKSRPTARAAYFVAKGPIVFPYLRPTCFHVDMLLLRKYFPIFFSLFLAPNRLPGQSVIMPKVEYIGVENGLPYREISIIVQDGQGIFWLSSHMGVVRYDGYQFVPLRILAKNGRLLPPAHTRIFLLPDGKLLLVAKESRFFMYDPTSNEVSIHPIHQITKRKLLPVYAANNILIEKGGTFLLEMQKNSRRYLMRYEEAVGLTVLDSTKHLINNIGTITKDRVGNLFWGTVESGIRRYTPEGKLADSLCLSFTRPDGSHFWSNECFFNKNERLFVKHFDAKSLVDWDWRQGKVLPSKLPLYKITSYVTNDQLGNTWMVNPGQLLLLDAQDELHDLTPVLKEKADFDVLRMVMEDAQGQIWVTSDNGVFRLVPPGGNFVRYLSAPQPKWAKTTRGFFEDKNGVVYFRCESCGATPDSTIFRINESIGRAEPVSFWSLHNPPDGLFSWTKSFYKVPGMDLVWTVGKQGILQMNLANNTVQLLPAVPSSMVDNSTAQVGWGTNRNGEILAGGKLSVLFSYNPASEKIRKLLPGGVNNEQESFVRLILEAGDGTLWVGLDRGLYQVDISKGNILRSFSSETHTAFMTDEIQALFEDKDGTIWVGTFGGGLVHIFPKTGEAINFNTADGLPNNIIADILPWKEDYLWISTFNGLTCFNKKNKTFVNFYEEDGLSHNEFNRSSAFIDSKGRYYFGGMNGVNAFYPEAVMKPQTKPLPLLLTAFSFYDEKKDTLVEQFGGLQNLQDVTLNPYISWFQFNYALPDFLNPRLNQFQTWLENFEKGWTYQGTTPFIRYNRLPAGKYILHIKAADSKGFWSEKELTIRINVQQVFYKTWWFILLCCLAVGAGAYGILRYRYQQRLALERMRTRIASDLHDEVGSSLSHLNFLVGSFDVENSPETTAKAIEKSKELMRKTASNIRDVVWAIDARRDKTGDLLDRMEDFAFDMFGVKNISHHFSIEGINREAPMNPFVRQNIYLIFKEAVNNIAKHSNATEVHISLAQKGEQLELTVADNGHSVNGSKVKGQGLENMELRAKRIGGAVAIENNGEGWTVRLRV